MDLDPKHRGRVRHDGVPAVSGVRRCIHLPAGRPEVDPGRIQRVDRHCIAQDVDVAAGLWQAVRKRSPLIDTGPAAVDAQLAVGRNVLGVAFDRDDVDRLGLVRVDVDRESEVRREVPTDFAPRVARVVGAHDIPVLLHEEHVRTGWVHRDAMHAMTDLGIRVRDALRPQAVVDRPPTLAGAVAPEGPGRRDRHEHPISMLRIEDDRVETHSAGAWRPVGRGAVLTQGRKLVPALATVGGTEESRVFGARIDGVRIGQGWLEVPDSLEFEGTRRSVIPLMRAGLAIIGELALHRLPCLAAVVGALDHLPEPARILRGVQPVRVGRRPFDVVDLTSSEVRAGYVPLFAFRVRRHDKRTFVSTDQYAYSAHPSLLPAENHAIRQPQRLVPTPTITYPTGRFVGRLEPKAGLPAGGALFEGLGDGGEVTGDAAQLRPADGAGLYAFLKCVIDRLQPAGDLLHLRMGSRSGPLIGAWLGPSQGIEERGHPPHLLRGAARSVALPPLHQGHVNNLALSVEYCHPHHGAP